MLAAAWHDAGLPPNTALLGVGGYGRGELFPYSDVDILVLLPGEPDAQLKAKLEALIGRLWDAGLEPGQLVNLEVDVLAKFIERLLEPRLPRP